MPAGEQIALEPAFALVLAEHFHHAPGGGEKFVVGGGRGVPLAVGRFEDGFQTVGEGFVGAEDAEIALRTIQLHERAGNARARACRLYRAFPATPRRRRSRGSPACAGRAEECRRWRADWRPCVVCPRERGRPGPVSGGRRSRSVPRADNFAANPPTAVDAREASSATRRVEPDALGTCLRSAGHPPLSGLSSLWAN